MQEPPSPPGEDRAVPPAPAADAGEGEDGALRNFLGLFVVPLLVVVLCVAVFVGFGWIAYDRQSTTDYLNDLESSWGPRRRQAAYELSKILTVDPRALAEEPGAEARVRQLFDQTDDEKVRQYLALVLGRTGDREAVPELAKALGSADSQTRIYALLALGEIGDPAARPAVAAELADRDSGIRKTAAFALGELGDPAAVDALAPLAADPVADVRFNAALALARLGSDAGRTVIEQMLDRRLLAQVPGMTPEQQEQAMVQAVGAYAAVAGKDALPTLDRLAEADPSLKVRQAAIEARDALSRN
jgi:HEAT repeat protein